MCEQGVIEIKFMKDVERALTLIPSLSPSIVRIEKFCLSVILHSLFSMVRHLRTEDNKLRISDKVQWHLDSK